MSFRGTIKPKANFDDGNAADELENAMKGRGCDKQKIVEMMTGINNAQRQMIRTPYRTKYGKELVSELKKELSGDLEDVIVGLMETPTKYDAIQMYKALKGLGTRESTLIDVLCSRTNAELLAIKREFEKEYGVSLEDRIVGDTSGDFQALLVALLQGNRDMSYNVDVPRAREEAKKLMGNKERKEKPSKEVFCQAFSTENFRQLKRMFSEYMSMNGETIQEGIKRVFSGDAEVAYLALVDFIENKERYFAKQLYASMEGLGTRDTDLIRVIIARSEIDLADIHSEFDRMYKKSLIDWLKSECSGAYRDALISIVNGN
uniref:Annexin n=2 Tax=Ascaris TaxID=6251 RepID=A0A0M3HZY4_ASCLU